MASEIEINSLIERFLSKGQSDKQNGTFTELREHYDEMRNIKSSLKTKLEAYFVEEKNKQLPINLTFRIVYRELKK